MDAIDPQRKAAILAALDTGKPFDEVLRSFARPQETRPPDQALLRASLVGHFDEALYRVVLAAHPPTAASSQSFDAFVGRPEIEPIPRSLEYRLTEEARRSYSSQLQEPGKTAVRKLLIDYYRSLGPQAEMDLLEQQIEISADEAFVRIQQLFDEADRNFDHALFESLLRLIADRKTNNFNQLYATQYRRLHARTLFIDDYYRTLLFYPRPNEAAQIDNLLADTTPQWMMMLHARGGSGKTMFLRWLAARDLVESRRIPVGYLDLDDYRLDIAAQYPWLLWLPLIQQWKEQLIETGLETILWSFRHFLPLIQRLGARESQDLRLRTSTLVDEFVNGGAQDLLQTLRSAVPSTLGSAPTKTPVVAIIDTLEEASLHRPQILTSDNPLSPGMLDLFAELRSDRVRVILSGRYNLLKEGNLVSFREKYAKLTLCCEPSVFTKEDAADYLKTKRRLSRDDMVEAIVEKSLCIPFQLSLLADLTLGGELNTVDEIRGANVDVAYLIQRVIARIPEPEVRWIVRYGALCRRLDKDFVMDVMLPHLERGMRDENDAPDRRYWIATTPNPELGWLQLTNYVSAYGWVKATRGGLQFGPEVRNPLRRILRGEKVVPLIHQDAAAWFAAKAASDPDNWVQWKSEELYHRLQLNQAEGLNEWRKTLASGAVPDLNARWTIAQLLFDRDFLDIGDGIAAPLDAALLAEAHYELASVKAQQAALDSIPSAQMEKWAATEREYNLGQQQASLAGREVLDGGRRTLIQGAILLGQGKQREALELQRAYLDRDADPQYRVPILVQNGVALFAIGEDGTDCMMTARDEAIRLPQPLIRPAQISQRLVEELLKGLDRCKMGKAYQALLQDLKPGTWDYEVSVLGYAIQSLILAGDIHGALRLFSDGKIDPASCPFAAPCIATEIAIRTRDLQQARMKNDEALAVANQRNDSVWRAIARNQRGRVTAGFFDLNNAITEFDAAKDLYNEAGSSSDSAVSKMQKSDVVYEIQGDTELALKYLLDVSETQLAVKPFVRTFWLARRIRLCVKRGEDRQAGDLWSELRRHLLQTEDHCGYQAWGWSVGAAMGVADEEDLKRLIRLSQDLQPPSARSALLEFFRWAEHAYPVLRMLPDSSEPDPDAPDWIVQQVLLTDYDRARGLAGRAADRIRQAWKRVGRNPELPVWIILARASGRVGVAPPALLRTGAEGALEDFAFLENARYLPPAQLSHVLPTLSAKVSKYSASVFEGRVLELRAALEVETGDKARALVLLQSAAALYQRLGQESARQGVLRTREKLGAEASFSESSPMSASFSRLITADASPSPQSQAKLPALVTVEPVGTDFTIRVNRAGQSETSFPIPPELCHAIARGRVDDLAKLLMDPAGAGLPDFINTTPPQDAATDVRILTPQGRAAMWPWERRTVPDPVANPPGSPFLYRALDQEDPAREMLRWVQAAIGEIPDGVMGPKTFAALAQRHSDFGLAATDPLEPAFLDRLATDMKLKQPIRVVVIAPPQDVELRYARGYRYSGVDVVSLWRSAGCLVNYRESTEPSLFKGAFNVDVVHVLEGFFEARGEIWFRSGGNSAVILQSLESASNRGTLPAVILDTPPPDSDFDAYCQLLMRNSVAHDLFRLRAARIVLACGLVRSPDLARVAPAFIDAVTNQNLRAAIRVWAAQPASASFPPSLFCRNPDLPAWSAPWASRQNAS